MRKINITNTVITPPPVGEKGDYCEKHKVKKSIFNTLTGGTVGLCDKCVDETDQIEKSIEARKAEAARQGILRASGISPRFKDSTIENFIITNDDQREAVRRVESIYKRLEWEDKFTGAIFCGLPGTGKNHLASAILTRWHDEKRKSFMLTSVHALMLSIRETWNRREGKTESEIISRYTSCGILVIDEVGVQSGSETEQNIMSGIINTRYEWYRPTILISNLPLVSKAPGEMSLTSVLGERVIDRFREGHIVTFTWESHRGKGKVES